MKYLCLVYVEEGSIEIRLVDDLGEVIRESGRRRSQQK
jgi:hypothetical protein